MLPVAIEVLMLNVHVCDFETNVMFQLKSHVHQYFDWLK